jgi:branched-chain amino acid aminotransferase
VLHYAQEIFEGLKAYRVADGGIALFRPEANAARFRASAARMAMAQLPERLFLDSLHQLIEIDEEWVPDSPDGSLYLRPFMYASEVYRRPPASEQFYLVIASRSGRTSRRHPGR